MDLRATYDAMAEIEDKLQAEIRQTVMEDSEFPEHMRPELDYNLLRYAAAASLMVDYLSGEICKAIDAGELPEDPWGCDGKVVFREEDDIVEIFEQMRDDA